MFDLFLVCWVITANRGDACTAPLRSCALAMQVQHDVHRGLVDPRIRRIVYDRDPQERDCTAQVP